MVKIDVIFVYGSKTTRVSVGNELAWFLVGVVENDLIIVWAIELNLISA